MTGLNSWLSPAVLHALGWALIHSLWQCAGVAALAALVLTFIRRPAVRYLVGVGALVLMLVAPVATFLVLAKPVAPVQMPQPATASILPATSLSTPVAVFATADRAIGAIADAPRQFPLSDILPWLVGVWACGVAFFSLRFAGGFLLLEHRRRMQSHSPGEHVLVLCLDLQSRLGLDRAIQYLECTWVETPAVIGWLRPAVLLPVFALTGLSEEQFKAVIAHELAHIRRHDWLVNLFQVLVESLLFYHPAMWWLNRRIRIERELCCDEIAVALTGSRLEYARALTQMAEWKNVSMLAMAANRGPLTQRIFHILGRKPSGAGQRVAGLTGGMLFLCAALAAANLLFGIAYPVQMAEAKESVKVALVSSQAAVAEIARQVVLTAKDAAPPSVAPDKIDAAADGKADTLAVPPSDLTRLLPSKNLVTPTVLASSAPSTVQAPAGAASNDQEKVIRCSNTSVFGRVLSSEAVQLQGFNCTSFPGGPTTAVGTDANANAGISFSSELRFGSCPNASADPSGLAVTNRLGRAAHPCAFDVQMNVRLADLADSAKMRPGKMVRLAGDFHVIRRSGMDYLSVTNAKVIWTDPFDRHASADQPAPKAVASNVLPVAMTDQPVTLASAAAPRPGEMVRRAGDFQITRHNDTYSIMLASAAAPEPGSLRRSRTELAMKCWLGVVEYNGCWQSDGCDAAGPVQRVEYLGSTATGGEVYQVRYQFEVNAYVIVPDPKGNADQYLVKATDHYWIKREISPPAAPILIYTRPETAHLHACPRDSGPMYSLDNAGSDSGRAQSGMPLPSEPGHPH
jgi:beta-lactamase regulating signal transducer with metallopeptidase domain